MNPNEQAKQAARHWFASNCYACIAQAINGTFKVNDLEKYKAWQMASAQDFLDGKNDTTFAFIQKAWYIQTGESVAFLPK